MNNLKHLTDLEKRKWLVNEMKTNWSLEEDDIKNDDCSDDAIVNGNAEIDFKTIFNFCNQLDWIGFDFGFDAMYIDILVYREVFRDANGKFAGECYLPTPDQFSIENGVIRIWWD